MIEIPLRSRDGEATSGFKQTVDACKHSRDGGSENPMNGELCDELNHHLLSRPNYCRHSHHG